MAAADPPDLNRKYDVRGPRYTSYPTAPHFRDVDPLMARAIGERWRLRNGLQHDPGLGLYLHVPFCLRRCHFCGCHTFGRRPDQELDLWLEGMVAEMDLLLGLVDSRRPVEEVALGGGTPTAMGAARIRRLLGALEERFALSPDTCRSVEVDPDSAEREALEAFLDHGFQRFSLGVQDFHPEVRARAGRARSADRVLEVVGWLREGGARHLNLDLVVGLPGQDTATAEESARQAAALAPGRLALYTYAHLPWARPNQAAMDEGDLPGPEERVAMRSAMDAVLRQAGYLPIGMDHYALPGDPLLQAREEGTLRRSFMGYTTGRDLDIVAMGPSAISQVGDTSTQDEKELAPWLAALGEQTLPWARGFLLSPDDVLRREAILDLSCNFRLDLPDLSRRLGVDARQALAPALEALRPMEEDGLVRWRGDTLEVTPRGQPFVRNVCMAFDRYLERDKGRLIYSRTV